MCNCNTLNYYSFTAELVPQHAAERPHTVTALHVRGEVFATEHERDRHMHAYTAPRGYTVVQLTALRSNIVDRKWFTEY